MFFGFDGNTEGFKKVLTRIADNHDGGQYNHKEVRAYARCLLQILPEVATHLGINPEIEILLACLTTKGLPHYDRAFLANCILKLLEDSSNQKTEDKSKNLDEDDIPF